MHEDPEQLVFGGVIPCPARPQRDADLQGDCGEQGSLQIQVRSSMCD
jgi:hypothetical protein